MTGVKAFLYGMYDVVVFPCWIVLFMCLIRMKKRYAAPLFVWGVQPSGHAVLLRCLHPGWRAALGSLGGSGYRCSCVFSIGLDRSAIDDRRLLGQ